jgi:hypothetical protein
MDSASPKKEGRRERKRLQRIAGHADSRTTKLYDRRGQKVLLEDMERNAELGISFQMSSTVKCGVSRMNVLWERILE